MKNMSKTTKSSLITYGLVVLAYVVAEIFMKTGHMTSLLKGLLVPLCVYAILAVSLNLTVGILGELSLGHAGFMCVGAFTSAVFTKCMMHTITVPTVRFLVVPASQAVYKEALKEGLLQIFMESGAIVMNPNCSVCWGSCQGVIGEGETLISTGTRNFKGRAGHRDSFVYLASAATVTASAIKGEIATADMLD